MSHVRLALLAVLLLPASQAAADQMTIFVPGFSDPWLAGMPAGSKASAHPSNPSNKPDVAPAQSPVLINGTLVTPGAILTFSNVTGTAAYGPAPLSGPDNKSSGPDGMKYRDGGIDKFIHHLTGAENGISDIVTPTNALLGVFLGPAAPNTSAAPHGLDFGPYTSTGVTSPSTLNTGMLDAVPGGTGYASLAPGLQQVFFIGDGQGASGQQQIVVPDGATRLYLGTADGWDWTDNRGGFNVTIDSTDGTGRPAGVPEPGALALAALGALALGGGRVIAAGGLGWNARRGE